MDYSNFNEIAEKKIIINNLSISNLNKQIEISHLAIKIQLVYVANARSKRLLIEELNEIFKINKNNFSNLIKSKINELYNKINKLDEPNEKYNLLTNELEKLKQEMFTSIKKINKLNDEIENKLITNYKVKRI